MGIISLLLLVIRLAFVVSLAIFGVLLLRLRLLGHDVLELRPEGLDGGEFVADLTRTTSAQPWAKT